MKKVFSLLMAVVVVAAILGASVGTVSAAGSAVVLHVRGVTQQDLEGAMMFAGSEYRHVNCVLKDAEAGRVVCRVNGRYAGQAVRIYLAGRVFFVTAPEPRTPEVALTCTPPEVAGALVLFSAQLGSQPSGLTFDLIAPITLFTRGSYQDFVPGATLAEVGQNAAKQVHSGWKYEIMSDLMCGNNAK